MFSKVLVANRGEIAVRVIRALDELGIASVAVYSEADRDAQHVKRATEAYLLGPGPAAESYLKVDKLLEVVEQSGAEAVHPGLDLSREITAAARHRFGETVLLRDGGRLTGFAVKHRGDNEARCIAVPHSIR